MRKNRNPNQLRPVLIEPDVNIHAEGSALISVGHTRVLCTASIEEKQPSFLRGTETGWITAEYGMLPRATHVRGVREASRGRQSGRTLEIQRLIGRSMRAVADLNRIGPRTIHLDCDVIQADGGTRCAAITGAWVALRLAVNRLLSEGLVSEDPLIGQAAAVSCGIVEGTLLLDLDYSEDMAAQMDANFILDVDGGIIEVQATAEGRPVAWREIEAMYELAKQGIATLGQVQQEALKRKA